MLATLYIRLTSEWQCSNKLDLALLLTYFLCRRERGPLILIIFVVCLFFSVIIGTARYHHIRLILQTLGSCPNSRGWRWTIVILIVAVIVRSFIIVAFLRLSRFVVCLDLGLSFFTSNLYRSQVLSIFCAKYISRSRALPRCTSQATGCRVFRTLLLRRSILQRNTADRCSSKFVVGWIDDIRAAKSFIARFLPLFIRKEQHMLGLSENKKL